MVILAVAAIELLQVEFEEISAELLSFEAQLADKPEGAAALEPLRERLADIERQIAEATAEGLSTSDSRSSDDDDDDDDDDDGQQQGRMGREGEDLADGYTRVPAPAPMTMAPTPAVYFDPKNVRVLDDDDSNYDDDPNASVEVGSIKRPPPAPKPAGGRSRYAV